MWSTQRPAQHLVAPIAAAVRLLFVALVAAAALVGPAPASAAQPWEVTQTASGDGFACALRANGTVTCWGRNEVGQLGNGTTVATNQPQLVGGLTGATAIAAGWRHTCALIDDGTVKCWGYNGLFQVLPYGGNSTFTTPVTMRGVANAKAISAGFANSCAVITDGTVKCWGAYAEGQMGLGSIPAQPVFNPAAVAGITDAVAVAVGQLHICALRASGQVSCWGGNSVAQAGNGTSSGNLAGPVSVSDLSNAVAISTASFHTCALTTGHEVRCWGNAVNGETGEASVQIRPTPHTVLDHALAVGAGQNYSCALIDTGDVDCWGSADTGRLGLGPFLTTLPGRIRAVNGGPFAAGSQLSVGATGACVLEPSARKPRCWGARMDQSPPNVITDAAPGNAYDPTLIDFDTPRTTDDVPTNSPTGPVTVTLTVNDPVGLGVTTQFRIVEADGTRHQWRAYDPAGKPVLTRGQSIEYQSQAASGANEPVRQSASLDAGAVSTVTMTDPVNVGAIDLDQAVVLHGTYATNGYAMPSISTTVTHAAGGNATPDVDVSGLPSSLGANQSAPFTITISPTGPGLIDFTVTFNDDSAIQRTVHVTGQVTNVPGTPRTDGAYGSGSAFSRRTDLSFSDAVSQVAMGDFDNDRNQDLVAGSPETGAVFVVRAPNAPGKFTARQTLTGLPAPGPMGLAVGDLDGDGDQDITSGSRVWLNDGTGHFAAGAPTGLSGRDVAIGDLDGNGTEDLVLLTSSGVTFARGDGTGAFASTTEVAIPNAASLVVRDLDDDGDLDVLVGTGSDNTVRVLRNDGQGHLGDETHPSGGTVPVLAVGHATSDLRLDVITPTSYLPGQADGSLGAAHDATGSYGIEALGLADLDGDGNDDELTADHGSSQVEVRLGRADGTFRAPEAYSIAGSGGSYRADVATFDLDENGRPDAVIASGSTQLSVLFNGAGADQTPESGQVRIREVRFGGSAYAELWNRSSKRLRLDGWRVHFDQGADVFLPNSTVLAPGASVLLTAPTNAGWTLGAEARSVYRMPQRAKGVQLLSLAGSELDAVGLDGYGLASHGWQQSDLVPQVAFKGEGAYVRLTESATTTSGATALPMPWFLPNGWTPVDSSEDGTGPSVLGAPRPDGPFAPTDRDDILQSSLADPSAAQTAAPNRVIVPGTTTAPTQVIINRRLTNCSGGVTTGVCVNADPNAPALTVTRLRFRVTGITGVSGATSPSASPNLSQLAVTASNDATYGAAAVKGLPLDSPSQASGGGLNSTLTATQLLPPGGLAPGQSITVSFALNVYSGGAFLFGYAAEDDVTPYGATATGGDAPLATPPAAEPVPESAKGSLPEAVVTAPIAGAKQAANAKPAASKKCLSKAKYRRLSKSKRAKYKICTPTKPTGKTKTKKVGR